MLKSSHLSRAHNYLDHASKVPLVDIENNSNKHLSKSNEKNVIFQSTVIGIEWICCEPNEKTNRNSNKHSMNLKVFFRIEWLFLWSNQKHSKIQRILFYWIEIFKSRIKIVYYRRDIFQNRMNIFIIWIKNSKSNR